MSDEDWYDDQFTITRIETGKLHLEGDEDIVLSLPRTITKKARVGWSITMEIARVRGKWRILGVGNGYP